MSNKQLKWKRKISLILKTSVFPGMHNVSLRRKKSKDIASYFLTFSLSFTEIQETTEQYFLQWHIMEQLIYAGKKNLLVNFHFLEIDKELNVVKVMRSPAVNKLYFTLINSVS